ncbi:MAG: alpha/beta hydrolase [Chloroflexota bacterium]
MVTIVAVHGNGGSADRFGRVVPFVPRPTRLVAVTLPGFGGRPLPPGRLSLAGFAEALGDAVATASRPRVVLGHGIGGSIALELARLQPCAMDGLILHAPVGARLGFRAFPRLMRLPGALRVGRALFTTRALRRFWVSRVFTAGVSSRGIDWFFDDYDRCTAFGLMFELITADWFESLTPLSVPLSLLWGERDRVLDASQVDSYRRIAPNAIIRVIPRWDHFPMIDSPAAYADVISSLARELTGA